TQGKSGLSFERSRRKRSHARRARRPAGISPETTSSAYRSAVLRVSISRKLAEDVLLLLAILRDLSHHPVCSRWREAELHEERVRVTHGLGSLRRLGLGPHEGRLRAIGGGLVRRAVSERLIARLDFRQPRGEERHAVNVTRRRSALRLQEPSDPAEVRPRFLR